MASIRSSRALWVLLAAALVLLSAPLWHAIFEHQQLRIDSIDPSKGQSGTWVHVHGDHFMPQSRFWVGKVEVREKKYLDPYDYFIRIP